MVREKRGFKKRGERAEERGESAVIGDTQQGGCLLSLKEDKRKGGGGGAAGYKMEDE